MLKKISTLAILALIMISCDISESSTVNCPEIIGVGTTAVTGPSETTVNTEIDLEVSYKARKNCGGFSSFYKNTSSDPLVDIITVNNTYNPCSCDQVESIQTANYTFKKSTAGIYIVKFKKTNEIFVEHTVIVQ